MKNIITNIFAKLALVAGLALASTLSWGQTVNVLTLDCATPAPTGTTSTALSSTSDVATFLNSAAGLSSAANKITSSAKSGDVYKGKGNGGGDIPQQCLKIGKASGGGGFTFTIPSTYDAIDVVELTCYGWKTTSSISINSGTAQTFTTAQSVTTKTFDLATSSRTINISVTTSAVCVTEIVLKKKSGGSSAAATTTTISAAGITNTDVYYGTAAGSLSASVTAGGNPIDGASVTWSGNNEAVATINASSGVVTLVAAGTVTFTASYAGDSGTYQASSDTYEMTVTNSAPYEQPTKIEITPNYTFWGKTGQFSGSTYDELSGGKDNVTLVWSRGSGSTYANSSAMRFYKDNVLTFTAPTGYEIKSIDLTVSDTYSDLAFSPSGWNGTDTKWTGSSETVTMSRPSNASSYATISKFTIIIGAPSTVTTPTISPADGTTFGNDGLDVTISAANGTIYYTLDGTAPTSSSSAYSEAIHITTTTTVKAIAVDGSDVSNVASATYTYVDPNAPGTQNNPYTVSQARAAIDAGTGVTGVYATGIVSEIVTEYSSTYHNISYNISSDGLTTSDQLQAYRGKSYNGNNFTSADDIQVGDIVVVYGNLKKYNSTYEFDQNNQLVSLVRKPAKPATPTFSPAAGAVIAGTEVTISTTTDGATIYYTTDGNEPTTSSTEYTKPIIVSAPMTIKAIAVKDAVSSDVANAAYTIAQPVATPTFSPDGGTYTSVQSVEISCKTEDATIYYTTNGDTPTTSSTEYTSAISVNENMTIKAIAVKDGMANSSVAEAAFTINIPSIVFDEATNPFNVEYSASSANIHFNASHTIGDLILVLCDSEGNATTYDWFSASISGDNVAASWQANADTENSRTAYFKLTADNAVSAIFAVVQAKLVVDYATLPFEWNGGTAAGLNARTGVTVEGAGSDYADSNAPYRIKFDGVGDYILVKTDSRPGMVTIAVKMLGGGNTSKIKVQESADGNTFTDVEELTISGALNTVLNLETTNDFAATTRFVNIIKSVHGSNIGIGPISITAYVAPSTDPAISAEDVNIGCNDTEGSISFTISNPVNGGVVTASKEADWLTLDTIVGGSVPFTCTENTGDVRSATVTLTYSYNTDQTVTKDVTVTQAAYVAPQVSTNWELTTLDALTANDVFIIIANNGDTFALPNNVNTSSAPAAVSVKVSGDSWSGVIADNLMWNIEITDDGFIFHPNGSPTSWLYCINDNNGVRVGTGDAKHFNQEGGYLTTTETSDQRYIGVYNSTDWRCYKNTTNNIAGQSFAFYKQVVSSGVATSVTVTCKPNGGRNWGTFYSGQAQYVIPDNVPAKAYTMNSAHQLYLLGENGHIIPKGVAVIIISDVESVTLNAVFRGSASVSDTNILVGSDTAVENNGKQYVLGIKDGVLKFYLLGSIEVPAGKAYYVNE